MSQSVYSDIWLDGELVVGYVDWIDPGGCIGAVDSVQSTGDGDNTFAAGSQGGFSDGHYSGAFQKPYTSASVSASQMYWWRCPCDNSNQKIITYGPIAIQRQVSQNSNGSWRYTIQKDGLSTQINPLP